MDLDIPPAPPGPPATPSFLSMRATVTMLRVAFCSCSAAFFFGKNVVWYWPAGRAGAGVGAARFRMGRLLCSVIYACELGGLVHEKYCDHRPGPGTPRVVRTWVSTMPGVLNLLND